MPSSLCYSFAAQPRKAMHRLIKIILCGVFEKSAACRQVCRQSRGTMETAREQRHHRMGRNSELCHDLWGMPKVLLFALCSPPKAAAPTAPNWTVTCPGISAGSGFHFLTSDKENESGMRTSRYRFCTEFCFLSPRWWCKVGQPVGNREHLLSSRHHQGLKQSLLEGIIK